MKKAWIMVLAAGLVVGAAAVILMKFGNPKNMGFCIACFERDIAGALKLHAAPIAQYLRPEIFGILLGAFLLALLTKEFKPQGGSMPAVRFLLGMFMMIGTLVFLGCPLRMTLRLGGGDMNAAVGFGGFIAGIFIGVVFLERGYSPTRTSPQRSLDAFVLPLVMLGLLAAAIVKPKFIAASATGPGSQHAALWMSLVAGLAVGALAQRSRLCQMGGIRDVFLVRSFELLSGYAGILAVVLTANLLMGNFKFGFSGQPIAHSNHLWNFMGMSLVGLVAVLLNGCPMRQLVLAGNGNTDSALTVFGMIVGAAVGHNFGLVSVADTAKTIGGPAIHGKVTVIAGLAVCVAVGLLCREKPQRAVN